MTNEERLQAIKKREAAATPGPWKADKPEESEYESGVVSYLVPCPWPVDDYFAVLVPEEDHDRLDEDAEFIAAAREDIPWLVAKLEAACREIIDLQDKLEVVEGSREPGVFYIYRDDKTWQLGENGQWRRCE